MTSRRLAVLIAASAALSGCADWRWPPEAVGPAPAPVVAAPAAPRISKPIEPAPPRPTVTARTKAAAPPPSDRPAAADKGIAPKLVGLSEAETADVLGRPAEETEQSPGKVWTYRTDGCQLTVHLFPDMDKGGFYALDYAAGEAPRDWCLARIAQDARKKG
ncbi:MAG: hypothetical protein ACM31L_03695 [Actinomycetota bacterium]